jgi:replicative DNA helicase
MNRVIEGSKLGDAVEPNNSFIRDSGAIEQDADWVCFLLPSKENFGYIRCFFTKNRFGQISTLNTQLWFVFNGATSTFSESINPTNNASHGMGFGFSQGTGIIKDIK